MCSVTAREMDCDRAAQLSYLASVRSWRQEASHLREHAERPALTTVQREAFLRQADAAERQADWWLEEVGPDC